MWASDSPPSEARVSNPKRGGGSRKPVSVSERPSHETATLTTISLNVSSAVAGGRFCTRTCGEESSDQEHLPLWSSWFSGSVSDLVVSTVTRCIQ